MLQATVFLVLCIKFMYNEKDVWFFEGGYSWTKNHHNLVCQQNH